MAGSALIKRYCYWRGNQLSAGGRAGSSISSKFSCYRTSAADTWTHRNKGETPVPPFNHVYSVAVGHVKYYHQRLYQDTYCSRGNTIRYNTDCFYGVFTCLSVPCLLLLLCVLFDVKMNACPVWRLAATHCFPYVKKRIAVMYQHQTDLSPIEVAIDEMSAKVAELRLLCSASEVDMIRLQLKLQGSVSVQVRPLRLEKARNHRAAFDKGLCAAAGQCWAPRLRQSLPGRQQCQEISRQQGQTA